MLNRLAIAFIVLFWILMNVLLWRSEFKGQNELGSAVPVEGVWRRILTAPDDSALEISFGDNKVGYCRWRANVGEELSTGKLATEDTQPEGMIKRLSGYTIDLEGNLLLVESATRLRFELHGSFTARHQWKDFIVRISVRPRTVEFRGSAASDGVIVTVTDGAQKQEHRFTMADLQDPAGLSREFGLGFPENFVGLPGAIPNLKSVLLGWRWEARNDWLKIGHSKVRVYRLQTRLLDRYQIVVIVSRVGEILRVELPSQVALVNDALINL